jgi:hypothetical protein
VVIEVIEVTDGPRDAEGLGHRISPSGSMYAMTEEAWRPLGFDGDAATDYDVLNDGVPEWMAESFWQWVTKRFSRGGARSRRSTYVPQLVQDFLLEPLSAALAYRDAAKIRLDG